MLLSVDDVQVVPLVIATDAVRTIIGTGSVMTVLISAVGTFFDSDGLGAFVELSICNDRALFRTLHVHLAECLNSSVTIHVFRYSSSLLSCSVNRKPRLAT